MKKILFFTLAILNLWGCNKTDDPVDVGNKPNDPIDIGSKPIDPIDVDQKPETPYEFKNKLVFEDNFEQKSKTPNPKYWTLCKKMPYPWAKHLSESYDQVYVENGNLVILGDKVNDEYKTGGIETVNKFNFKYGKVEVRAKFTKAVKGGWPAIWMMPANTKQIWPNCGEIDIMERLNKRLMVHQTIHSHYKNTLKKYLPIPTKLSFIRPFKYNTYTVMWTPKELVFSINGRKKLSYPNLKLKDENEKMQWPFNKPYYIILNHALGGWAGKIIDKQLPGIMEIDWVKVYQ